MTDSAVPKYNGRTARQLAFDECDNRVQTERTGEPKRDELGNADGAS